MFGWSHLNSEDSQPNFHFLLVAFYSISDGMKSFEKELKFETIFFQKS